MYVHTVLVLEAWKSGIRINSLLCVSNRYNYELKYSYTGTLSAVVLKDDSILLVLTRN